MAIRVLLADDHALVRHGLRALLGREPSIRVIAQATDGLEAVEKALRLRPDVAILDIAMPGLGGLEAAEHIKTKSPKTRIIILTIYDDEEYVLQARHFGVDAFLSKGCTVEALIGAIKQVHRGESLLRRFEGGRGLAHLTPREKEVLALIAQGKTNKEIAALLGIRPKTAEAHRANLMAKLGIHTAVGLARYAIAKGLSK